MYNVISIGTTEGSINLLVMVVIFFISAILRKQLSEVADLDFSVIGSAVVGEITFFITMLLFGNLQWGFLASLVGILAGGFLAATFLDEGGEE